MLTAEFCDLLDYLSNLVFYCPYFTGCFSERCRWYCRLTGEDSSQDKSNVISKEIDAAEGDSKKLHKVGKFRSRINKVDTSIEYGVDVDGDQPGQGVSSSREEKVSSLKTVRSSVSIFCVTCLTILKAKMGLILGALGHYQVWL